MTKNYFDLTPARVARILEQATNYDKTVALINIKNQLAEYEIQHDMSTEEMRAAVVAGTLEETSELCAWLMLHNRYNTLKG